MATENEKETTLHYIDKNHNLIIEAGKSLNSVTMLLALFSFIVIALSSGIVSVDQKISLGGLNLTVPAWLLLVGGSGLVGSLLIYLLCLNEYLKTLSGHIRRLYQSINYHDESLIKPGLDATNDASILVIISSIEANTSNQFKKIIYKSGAYLAIIIWSLIPIVAEGFAAYKVISLYSLVWLIYFIPLILLSIGYLAINIIIYGFY